MSPMNTKNIKRFIALVFCITLVISSVCVDIPYSYAEEQLAVAPPHEQLTEEPAVTEPTEPVEAAKPEKTEAQKKKEKAAKKKAAHKKRQKKLVKFAKKQVGKSYKYGAKGPKTFDCIGLVYYVFKNAGVKLKSSVTYDKICHMKSSYSKYIVAHSKSKAKAGDIVFFYSGNKVKHACVAIGNGKCVNATKKGVKVMKIQDHKGCKTGVIRLIK